MSWSRSFGALALCCALTPVAFSGSEEKALDQIKKELADLRKENSDLQKRLSSLETAPEKGNRDLEREIMQLNARFASTPDPGSWDQGGIKKAAPTWIWSGNLRERAEWRSQPNGTDDFRMLSRLQMNLDVSISDALKVFAQLEDARIFGDGMETESGLNPNATTTTDDSSPEFSQIYAWMKDFMGTGTNMKIGRMAAKHGSGRIISGDEWANTSRSFEGFQADGSCGDLSYSLFLYMINATDSGATPDTYDDQRIYGFYSTYPLDPDLMKLDIYAVFMSDDGPAENNLLTLGARAVGDFEMFDYELEYAAQQNQPSDAGTTIDFSDAYMAHAGFGFNLDDIDGKPRIGFVYDHGSFDTATGIGWMDLHPTIHGRFGESDFFTTARNLVHSAVSMDLEVMDGWDLGMSFHWQRADEQAGTDEIGKEANLTLKGKCGDNIWMKISAGRQFGASGQAGYGVSAPWLAPTAGDRSIDATFGFVEFTIPF